MDWSYIQIYAKKWILSFFLGICLKLYKDIVHGGLGVGASGFLPAGQSNKEANSSASIDQLYTASLAM